jgi:predicted nucleic acid-binding protein
VSTVFLLDTDIVSNLRRAKPHPDLVSWLQSIPPTAVFMAAVTVAEIQCGIGQVSDQAVAIRVQDWLNGMLRDGQPRIADFDVRAAIVLGRMWTTPPLNNFIADDPRPRKIKSGADLAIAATAIARDMVVVTGNVDDFVTINTTFPLAGLFNPFDGRWVVEPAIRIP